MKKLTEAQVREKVESLVIESGSLRSLSREWGVSPSHLSDFLNGRRSPGPKILEPLGLVQELWVRYVPGRRGGRRRRVSRDTP